jgi:hypothetical protein
MQVPPSFAEQNVVPEHSVINLCVEGSRWLLDAEQLTPRGTVPDCTGTRKRDVERRPNTMHIMAKVTQNVLRQVSSQAEETQADG